MTEFPDTRSSLLVQVQSADDREAWEQFVLIYRPVIYRMARKRGMQDADAQDVVQAILVRVAGAIDRWEKLDSDIRFRHWLRRVAKNAICTALSRPPKEIALGGSNIQELLNEQLQVPPGIQQQFAYEQMREQYLRATVRVRADVSAETWQAFEMTMIDGKSCEEVADRIGKSVGTVYAARSRVMRRLRDQVQQLEREES